MPTNEVVVTDTSPLLNLALIDQLTLLTSQFSSISVPRQVWKELTQGGFERDALHTLRADGFLTVIDVEESDLFTEIFHELDYGETAAICYAIEQDADLLLLDEKDGRRVARRHDLTVTGVIGILLRGAKEGEVDIKQELDALREAGFWISDDLYSRVLSEAQQ